MAYIYVYYYVEACRGIGTNNRFLNDFSCVPSFFLLTTSIRHIRGMGGIFPYIVNPKLCFSIIESTGLKSKLIHVMSKHIYGFYP